MSSDTSNPILRRLGVAGVGDERHFTGGTWGTPHTHKTNPVAIGGHVWAYITPRGRLIPKPDRGGAGGRLFNKPLCSDGPHHGDF